LEKLKEALKNVSILGKIEESFEKFKYDWKNLRKL
jgi:hypothetical protein